MPVDVESVSGAIVEHLDAWLPDDAVVLTYASMATEIDPTVPARRRTLLLTRLEGSGPLTAHRADGPLEAHRYGFVQPTAAAPSWDGPIDVVLVPGLAFSSEGARLGRGAGHYDRFLASRPVPVRVGVTAEAHLVDGIPLEAHDVLMSHVVTQAGVRSVVDSP